MTRSQTPHDPADPFLTTREAALLLGVSLRSVQNYVERGDLHAGRTPGGHRRIHTSDVHTLAEKMGIKTSAEPTPMKERPDYVTGYEAGTADAQPKIDYERNVGNARGHQVNFLREEIQMLINYRDAATSELLAAKEDLRMLRAEVERLQAQLDAANLAGVTL